MGRRAVPGDPVRELPVQGRLARFLVPTGNASGSWIRRRFVPALIGLLEEVDEIRVPCLATTNAGHVDAGADAPGCGASPGGSEARFGRHRVDADLHGARPDDDRARSGTVLRRLGPYD